MTRRDSLRLLGLALLAGLAFPVGLTLLAGLFQPPAAQASGWTTVFSDDFDSDTGWNTSVCGDAPGGHSGCQWPGQIITGHNDSGVTVLRLAQDGGVTFPLVGREGITRNIPLTATMAVEIRFRFPETTDYGVSIGVGSASWSNTRYAQDVCVNYRQETANAFSVHQNSFGRVIRVFGAVIQSTTPDSNWHTIRVTIAPDGKWVAYVDNNEVGNGSGGFFPSFVGFGNHCEVWYYGNWTDLHIDYVRVEYWIDKNPPVTTIALDPSAPNGDNGWYRTPVQVTLSATDESPPVQEIRYRVNGGSWSVYTGPFMVSGDGTHVVEAYAIDRFGNVESPPKSVSFRIDRTPPSISWTASPATPDGNNGWYRSPITITFSCSDPMSGIASCGPNTVITAEGANLTAAGIARDRAGNTTTVTAGPFRRDATPPSVSGSISPPPNVHGWNRTPVTITWSGTDALSGVESCDPGIVVSSEGGGQIRTGSCRDRAGNIGTGQVTVNLDFTPPDISGSRSPLPNVHGWSRTDVTITWTCSDALSGILVCPDPTTVTQEGENQSVSGTARDRAGNERTAVVGEICIDKTPPVVFFSVDPPPNENGWHQTPVTIAWSGTDALSGIDSCDSPETVSGEGAEQSRIGSCIDRAGNTGHAEARVSIDLTPPRIEAFRSPLPNASGWVSTPVTVTFLCNDPLSGIDHCPAPVTVSTEGADQVVSGTARDMAGNTASVTVADISIDMTPPHVAAIPDRSPNARGWYTAPFTVTWIGSDVLSGVAQCDPSIRYEGPDTSHGTLVGACLDHADLRGEGEFEFRYDATPPAVTFAISPSVPNGRNGWWTVTPVVDFGCTDETAGVAYCSPPVTVTVEGVTTVLGTAEDNAGWQTIVPVSLRVDRSPPYAGLLLPASWCFPCSGPVMIGILMEDNASGVAGWSLRLESVDGTRVVAGTEPAEMIFWDGYLDGRLIPPGRTVTVTLVVTDVAGWSGLTTAHLLTTEPPPVSWFPVFRPTPAPTQTPAPTRARPVPTRRLTPTPEPVPAEQPLEEPAVPESAATPTPSPTPAPRVAQVPSAPEKALRIGMVFLDRNGNGRLDPDEPGIMGAVLDVMGIRITTGPDGRFYAPADVRARLLFYPTRGRLTVADGLMFGIQPRSLGWLAGAVIGMILLGLTWVLDPRPREIRGWAAMFRTGIAMDRRLDRR